MFTFSKIFDIEISGKRYQTLVHASPIEENGVASGFYISLKTMYDVSDGQVAYNEIRSPIMSPEQVRVEMENMTRQKVEDGLRFLLSCHEQAVENGQFGKQENPYNGVMWGKGGEA